MTFSQAELRKREREEHPWEDNFFSQFPLDQIQGQTARSKLNELRGRILGLIDLVVHYESYLRQHTGAYTHKAYDRTLAYHNNAVTCLEALKIEYRSLYQTSPQVPTVEFQLQSEWSSVFTIPGEVAEKLFTLGRSDPISLYRRESVSLLSAFILCDHPYKMVLGHPGTGKSASTFALITLRARAEDKKVLWVQCEEWYLARAHGSSIKIWQPIDIYKDVCEIVLKEKDIFVYLDQFRSTDDVSVSLFRFIHARVPWMVLAADGSMNLGKFTKADIKRFVMPPWTLDEFKSAVAHEPIRHRLLKSSGLVGSELSADEIVEMKHFHAGVSCRFMFDYTIDMIIQTIDDAISKCPNIHAIREVVRMETATVGAANHLVYNRSNDPRTLEFASKYIASQVGAQTNPEDILAQFNSFVQANGQNPPVSGYYFEAFLVSNLRQTNFTIEQIPYGNGGLVENFNGKTRQLGTWMRPTKFNNAGFDLVRVDWHSISNKMAITFLLATIEESKNNMNATHFVSVIKELKAQYAHERTIVEVDVYMVVMVPKAIRGRFEWKWMDCEKCASGLSELGNIDSRWNSESGLRIVAPICGLENSEVFVRP